MSSTPASFLSLPNELVLEIAENFNDPTDLFSLLVANKRLSVLLRPALDKISDLLQQCAAHSGLSLIHWSAMEGERIGAQLAIKLDPQCLNQFDEAHGTPLHVAVFEKWDSMVEFLLEQGADPNAVDPHPSPVLEFEPILHLAISTVGEDHPFNDIHTVEQQIVLLLLEWDADPNTTIENGVNAFLHAARLGLTELVSAILETGKIDINSTDSGGATALHIAVRRFRPSGVPKLLLDEGIDIDATNHIGQSALFHAAQPVSTELLISRGARTDLVDAANRTVLHYIASRRYPTSALHAAHILRASGGIDLGLKDSHDQTALEIAKMRYNDEVQKLLEKYQ